MRCVLAYQCQNRVSQSSREFGKDRIVKDGMHTFREFITKELTNTVVLWDLPPRSQPRRLMQMRCCLDAN